MNNNWKIQRRDARVAVKVPMVMEILDSGMAPHPIDIVAENISRDGFRFLAPQVEEDSVKLVSGEEYEVRIGFAKKSIRGIIRIVWQKDGYMGVRFIERERGWIVG